MDTRNLVVTARRMGIELNVGDANVIKRIDAFCDAYELSPESRSGALAVCFAKAISDKGIISNERLLANEIALVAKVAYHRHLMDEVKSRTIAEFFDEGLNGLQRSLEELDLNLTRGLSQMIENNRTKLFNLLGDYLAARTKERRQMGIDA